MMDFADQAPLTVERRAHLAFGFIDARNGPGEGVT